MMKVAWGILTFFWWWNQRRRRLRAARREQQPAHIGDVLPGLPNRAALVRHLDAVLQTIVRHRASLAVLYIDLDNFKLANNSLGHSAGDHLLAVIAQRLTACLPRDALLARIGGDEFVVMLGSIATEQEAIDVVRHIAVALTAPVQIADHEVFTTASIGIAFNHPAWEGADILLRDAHSAMCHAKTRGHGHYQVFDSRVENGALARLILESDLRRAVERGEFCVAYQPIVSLATGKMVEVEALVRWDHPRRGLLYPAEFIAVAEETGLILPLGSMILREACQQAHAWHLEFPTCPIQVSVNLSARQFQHEGLVDEIAGILEQTGLEPRYLKLEITESVLMHDVASTLDTLRQLKALGVRLAVDDFGTGYSSLNYLTRFPVDVLKIDRSFVDRLDLERESAAVISAIITLANSLNLEVVGEGLERVEQSNRLQELGCERGQGYFYARPLPTDGIRSLCADLAFPPTA